MANWLIKLDNKLRKGLDSLELNNESVVKGCELVIDIIEKDFISFIKHYNLKKESWQPEIDVDEIMYTVDEIKDNFIFLKNLLNGNINENEWDNYSFDGNGIEWFNNNLSELWDLSV